MMRTTRPTARHTRRLGGTLLLAFALLAAPARAQEALGYFKNYFVTGDYVAAGVGLQHRGVNGFATGNIAIDPAQIPAGAEIVAAYLYWQTISSSGTPDPSVLRGAKFKGNDISQIAVLLNEAGTAPCWGDGGATGESHGSKATWSYRADVLRFFPRMRPSAPNLPVQVQVAGSHRVTLPDMGKSNRLPSTLGAGLVVVYRVTGYDASTGNQAPRQPLRAIVLYDGGSTLDQRTSRLQMTLEGFYEVSRLSPAARMTMLVADGQSNKTERVQIRSTASTADDRLVAVNPFNGNTGFDVVTFPNLPLEAGAMKAMVTIDPGKRGCFDCLSLGATVLSVVVQDRDGDGLLDVWEARSEWSSKPSRLASVYPSWPLTDPTGAPLPDLAAMGASPDAQDVFVQIDYLTGSDGHSHLPATTALQAVATALHNAAPAPFPGESGRLSLRPPPRASARSTSTSTWAPTPSPPRPSTEAAVPRPPPGPPSARSFRPRSPGAGTPSPRRPARQADSRPAGPAAPSPDSPVSWAGRAVSAPTGMRRWIAPTARWLAPRDRLAASRGCRGRGRTSSTTRSSPMRWGTARSAIRSCRGAPRGSPTPAAAT